MKNYTKTMIDTAWFNRLLRHLARKWSGSILTTPNPAWGKRYRIEWKLSFTTN